MSTALQFSHRRNDDGSEGLSVLIDGQLLPPITSDHPNFDRVKSVVFDSLVDNDPFEDDGENEVTSVEQFIALFDPSQVVIERFQRLTDRVTVQGGSVLLDGDPVGEGITNQILRFLDDGEDFMFLVKFLENVAANPQPHSRDQLYDWLNTHEFTITDDGCLVGYKGVRQVSEGRYSSISSGRETVLVNDKPQRGYIEQEVGDTVEMARGLVQHDPAVGCHVGLHVGTHEYASSFGQVCLEVKVNPRDVVSVPTDCNWQKVRTCRYEIVGTVESKYTSAVRMLDVDGSREDDEAYTDLSFAGEFEVGDEVIDLRDNDEGVIEEVLGDGWYRVAWDSMDGSAVRTNEVDLRIA